MTQIWIVHRNDRERAGLERLAGAADAVAGAPGDPRFEAAPPAQVVVLGLADDWEAELEFAHRQRGRLGAARWVLVGDPADADAARALFDQLPLDFLAYPPSRAALLALLDGPPRPATPSLSQRAHRDAVAERFARWLADLELPDLLRATDPRLADVPLLVRGEAGSGRGTLVRYAHQFGGTAGGRLVHLPCDAALGAEEIEETLDREARQAAAGAPLCLWLDEVGRLDERSQRALAARLEAGAPVGIATPRLRWVASLDPRDPELTGSLAAAFGSLLVELPPLRERVDLEAIALATATAWSRQRRVPLRSFGADALTALREYPWPGNLREFEAVLLASLAHGHQDPIGASELRLPGAESAATRPAGDVDEPLEAASVGTLLSDENPGQSEAPDDEDDSLRRLAGALTMQVRNPLATIRSFAELLPERFDDPEFRERFAEMLREDMGRLHGLMRRLDQIGALDAPRREKVDVAALLESLLDGRRQEFRERHLLVLKELDPGQSVALADPAHLRLAFEALLDKALAMIPERGDLYLASRRHAGSDSGAPTTRVLFRFHDPLAQDLRGPAEHSLELLIAELLVRAQGGRLTLGSSDAEERLLVVDLPAP